MVPPDAEHQAGCFSRAQARAHGYSDRQITHRLATQQWLRLTPVTMIHRLTPVSTTSWMHAAILTGGPGAAISHLTAAVLLGLYAGEVREVHVTVPWRQRLRLPPPCVVHRTGDPDEDEHSVVVLGLRCTPPARTIIDCLGMLSPLAALRLVDEALQQRRTQPRELVRTLAERRRRHGIVRARHAVNSVDGAASEAERRAHRLLRSAGIVGWQPNFAVIVAGQTLAIVDIAFPTLRLAIEIDGMAWHTDHDRFQRDRTRQNALVAAGWTVLRFTWWDLTVEPERVLDEIRRGLTRLSA